MSKHLAAIFTLLLLPLGSCLVGCSQPQADEANPVPPADTSAPKRQGYAVRPESTSKPTGPAVQTSPGLAEARAGFQTKLVREEVDDEPLPDPPADLFKIVHYESPAGKLAAFLSRDPGDGGKHPAIIWITGGFCNSVGDTPWMEASPDDDQSGSAFRQAGIVMMYPALRGGSGNPGVSEGLYGEAEDVLAAKKFLASQTFVDPAQIYLGGHSTGGTLVLLAAELGGQFRAAFSFGPAHDVAAYGEEFLPVNVRDAQEIKLRSPIYWLSSIKCPVFVFEGSRGNIFALWAMKRASRNELVQFFEIKGADHFNTLAPISQLIAKKILQDQGTETNIAFTDAELSSAMRAR